MLGHPPPVLWGFTHRGWGPSQNKVTYGCPVRGEKKILWGKSVTDHEEDEAIDEDPLKENSEGQQGVVNVRGEDVVAYGKRMEEERALRKRVPLLNLQGQCKTKTYDMIMTKLEILQDNGEWEVFDKLTQDLLRSLGQGKKDLQCVIIIEQGVKQYYQNQMDKAMKTFQGAIALTDKTDNPELLRGRAYFLLSEVYREQRKLGLVETCLALSEQNLEWVKSDEDKAEFYYNCGNFLIECLNIASKPSRQMICKAKKCFRKELDIASKTPDKRVRVKKMQYALLQIAFLLLDCRNHSGRMRAVSYQDVQEAKECLDKFKNEFWFNIPKGTEIQFTLARSDQFYRQGDYARALDLARAALDNIERYGFTAETSKAQERIRHLIGLVREEAFCGVTADSLLISELSEGDLASGDSDGQESGVDVHDPNFAL